MLPTIPSPHCPPPAETDLDDKVCSCSPEPYWLEWLEEQKQKEKEKSPTPNPTSSPPPPDHAPELAPPAFTPSVTPQK